MPKSKTKRGREDLKGNAGPSKRSRLSSDPKKNKEIISSKVISKLKDVVKGDRTSAIEEWVKSHPVTVEGLTVEQSDLLCNAFRDESCWSGATLDVAKLVGELAKSGVLNPFAIYKIACIECVESEIKQLFDKALESFRSDLSHKGACEEDRNLACSDKLARVELLSSMGRRDPVFNFWIDQESGNLRENIEAEDGFNKAVDFKWSKGVEHFYNRLCSEEKLVKEEREKLLVSAIAKLSPLQSSYKLASTLNSLLGKVISAKVDHKSLLGLPNKKDRGVIYRPLSYLVEHGFLCTTKYVIQYLSEGCSRSEAEKMLSPRGYAHLLSSLSFVVVSKDYDLDNRNEARSAISSLWESSVFNQNKINVVDPFKDRIAFVAMENAISNLIVDQENSKDTQSAGDGEKVDLVLSILKFAKDCCSDKSFKSLKERIANSLDKTRNSKMIDATSSCNLIEELCKSARNLNLFSASTEGPQSTLVGTNVSISPAAVVNK
ncbi:hypothetical protein wCauA_05140 [Wolbachia endosymbiont of Carposina sasakii]|uniref:hypothetical protein n=1 Tax=Wolbachia endosymbiont of Carposina sasakii TaxID=2591635 RepID=UPI0011435B3B|nr:hypothetical protein [Wolbachia endosymbiont of Carposina sasakii]QDH18952.1 hypothetical protein wCauA_05140 [Wolbachia endosymbiont of Carposina sasakii]